MTEAVTEVIEDQEVQRLINSEHHHVTRTVPIEKLFTDTSVQRYLDQRKVAKMVREFDLDAFGTPTVSYRADGTYHVVDGQHRIAAMRAVGLGDVEIEVRVFENLTLPQEARMFRLLNNTTQPAYVDKFRIRVQEGDPDAAHLMNVITKWGWKLAGGSGQERLFAAVAAMERVYQANKALPRPLDPDPAERALATLTSAWQHQSTASDGRLVEGLGLVYLRYGDDVIVEDLVRKLNSYKGGPSSFLAHARGLKELLGVSVPKAVADVTVELYNKGRRTKALAPWRSV